MKYSLGIKAANNPSATVSVSFLEDNLGDITNEVCFSMYGVLEDFSDIEVSVVMNEKDLHNLIGMLIQAQQKVRTRNSQKKSY